MEAHRVGQAILVAGLVVLAGAWMVPWFEVHETVESSQPGAPGLLFGALPGWTMRFDFDLALSFWWLELAVNGDGDRGWWLEGGFEEEGIEGVVVANVLVLIGMAALAAHAILIWRPESEAQQIAYWSGWAMAALLPLGLFVWTVTLEGAGDGESFTASTGAAFWFAWLATLAASAGMGVHLSTGFVWMDEAQVSSQDLANA